MSSWNIIVHRRTITTLAILGMHFRVGIFVPKKLRSSLTNISCSDKKKRFGLSLVHCERVCPEMADFQFGGSVWDDDRTTAPIMLDAELP